MVHAVVAVEDKRFWTDPGVDIRGIARAFISDLTGGARQGASTIAEQFVKNVLNEQNSRTIFEKLREAALAFQLTHQWKKTKILTEYLNSIYFGNGAYGIESAARVYFGKAHGYDPERAVRWPTDQRAATAPTGHAPCRRAPPCSSPWEAALLAGMVANPTEFDPTQHPVAAGVRRNQVLQDMLAQHYITQAQYEVDRADHAAADAADLQQPSEPTVAPYFTSWLRPQILRAMGYHNGVPDSLAEYRAYYGGLKIKTTLDLKMQEAADQAIDAEFPTGKAARRRVAGRDRQQDRRG